MITNALLNGAHTLVEIANETGLPYSAVRYRLQNPVRCAWVSGQLQRTIPQRMGMVLAAAYRQAMAGDVRAMNLLLDRFQPLLTPGPGGNLYNTQINIGADADKMSDEELGARIQENLTKLGTAGIARAAEGASPPEGREPPKILDADFETVAPAEQPGPYPADVGGQPDRQDHGGLGLGDS
jgi:hypothetical protein